jgi:hypothetical protein
MVFDKDKGTSNISLLKTPTSLYVFLDSETFLNLVMSVVCSFLGHQSVCMPPLEFPRTFDSWYDCSKGAHRESVLLMNKMGYRI